MQRRYLSLAGLFSLAALTACSQEPMRPTPVSTAATPPAAVNSNPTVGGAEMFPTKDIVDNAVNSKDHTTLVAAVKAAGLVDTLKSPGPFTVFAPTNEAFNRLPKGTVQTLLRPRNKPKLVKVLTYHVVPGRLDSAALMDMVSKGGGRALLTTAEGATLSVTNPSPGQLIVTDSKRRNARVTIGDVYQSNGVIHVVDTVLLPPG